MSPFHRWETEAERPGDLLNVAEGAPVGPFLGPWGCDCLFQPWAQTGPATLGLGEEKGSFLSVLSEVDSELSRERRTLSSSPPNGFCLFLPPYRSAAPRKDPPWITLVQAEP